MHRGLTAFEGRFILSRHIEDGLTGHVLRFEGFATLRSVGDAPSNPQPSNPALTYAEEGVLIHPDVSRFHAERRYRWRAGDGGICVDFDDGRAFHWFDPVTGGAATEHLCGADLYRGGYTFDQWPVWSVTWDVTGPRKSYRSITRYVPHPD